MSNNQFSAIDRFKITWQTHKY